MAVSLRTAGVGVLVIALGIVGDAQQQKQPPPASAPATPPQQQAQPAQDQQPPPDQQKPLFRAGINFVRVDVIVTDKNGNALADLKPGDFEVLEDGKPQAIETFKLIKLDGGTTSSITEGPPRAIRTDADEELEASKDDVRLFAIFLDDYHVRQGASLGVRDPLMKFVETQLGPSDMIGIMYPLESTSSVRMTRNHSAVERALQQFVGRKYDYTPRNQIEERYAYYPADQVERIRNQVSLSAIKGLIVHMGTLKEGRKALILVSEGYTNMLPPQLRDPVAALPGIGNPNRNDPTAGVNNPLENSVGFFASVDLDQDLREVYETANRYNVAIYSVDPRGLATFEFDINEGVGGQTDRQYLASTQDTLRVLSEQTDGRAVVNRNDLGAGMKQIIRDSSAYYLIGYNSAQAPADGKFHEIKVRVKRSGVQLRARKGYWAVTPDDLARSTIAAKPGPPKAVEAALSTVSQPRGARVIRTWVGTSRGENGKTRVTFVWEPVPKPLGERDQARTEQPQRVAVMAVAPDGSPTFRGRVPDVALASTSPSSAAAGGGASAAPSPSRVTFDATPGKLQLRLSVEGSASQVLDSDIREISIPDLTSPQTTLGTPAVYRARNALEMRQLKADPQSVPTAGREFGRSDRLLLRVPAYGPANTTPTVSVHLLNRAGNVMSELPVLSLPTLPGDSVVDLPLAGLAAGEYLIEVKATGAGGEAKELIGFRVSS